MSLCTIFIVRLVIIEQLMTTGRLVRVIATRAPFMGLPEASC